MLVARSSYLSHIENDNDLKYIRKNFNPLPFEQNDAEYRFEIEGIEYRMPNSLKRINGPGNISAYTTVFPQRRQKYSTKLGQNNIL